MRGRIKKIYNFYENKYGLGIVGLLKCITVASLRIKNVIPLNLLVVAPSRQYKTQTSKQIEKIFPKSYYEYLGSDVTMHYLAENYENGKKLNNKTLLINDLTLLFGSKQKRTKFRLINGLAELLSDGVYQYGDRLSKGFLKIKCRVNLIANITIESYIRNYEELIANTFGERMLKIFYKIPRKQQKELLKTKENRFKMEWVGKKIGLKHSNYRFAKSLKDELMRCTEIASIPTQTTNLDDLGDKVKSLVCGFSKLRGSRVSVSDFKIMDNILPYLSLEGFTRKQEIQTLHLSGWTTKEIIDHFKYDKKSSKYVYEAIRELRERGVI